MPEFHREAARDLPVIDDTDVLVCGGGPAGLAAAVSAARAGARVRLLEVNGCLGGVWTSGLLAHIIDFRNKTGVMAEIMRRLADHGGQGQDRASYQPETMKWVLERMCADAGVRVRLHTRVVAAGLGEGRRLETVVTESKSGREAWRARVFIDATGDGDVAALAGCRFDVGHPQTGQCQPMSMMAILTGLPFPDIAPMICGLGGVHEKPKQLLLAEMTRAGLEPSYVRPTLFDVGSGLFALMANHEYGVPATDAEKITIATIQARAELHRLVTGLRSLGGVWQDITLVGTADQIGVREGRRIHSLYTVTSQDLINGARHDDAVCRVTFGVDVHNTDPAKGKAYGGEGVRAQPYDIPLRALIAKEVNGLLLAGRCISGDFYAHASYRVTGNAVAMGEAAGVTAALAAGDDVLPHNVPWPKIAAVLTARQAPSPVLSLAGTPA